MPDDPFDAGEPKHPGFESQRPALRPTALSDLTPSLAAPAGALFSTKTAIDVRQFFAASMFLDCRWLTPNAAC